MTHAKRSNNRKNIKLYRNPEPNNSSTTYVVPKIYKDDIESYNKKTYQNWKFHKFDKRKIMNIKKGK